MGSSASKEYKGPKNPETENLVFVIEEFTDYMKGNQFSIEYMFFMFIFIFFFILSLLELISNILLYRTRKRTYK
jgi:hypothetical protein|uniref:Uncharacterized protein n=1 Tax=viral metagenome TaxID=1070528 RepID=A0A6C0LCM7_9ZZZZ